MTEVYNKLLSLSADIGSKLESGALAPEDDDLKLIIQQLELLSQKGENIKKTTPQINEPYGIYGS